MLLVEGLSSYLTSDIIKRCKEAGIRTVLDFLSVDTESLSQKISTPYKDVTSIQRVLLACYSSFPQSGESLYDEQMHSLSILNTGSKSLDEFIDGGIYTGEITEIHGVPGAGKTQLCLSVVASLVSETKNTAVYIDTSGNFCGQRFGQILKNKSKDVQNMEENMKMLQIINVYDMYELFETLHSIKDKLCKQEDIFFMNLKLVVIDSIASVIAPYSGSKQFDAQGLMATVAQQLKLLCTEHALSVVVCNNMVRGEDTVVKPALGRYWSYIPSVVLSIEKTNVGVSNNIRKVSVFKSCRRGTFGNVTIQITDDGICPMDAT